MLIVVVENTKKGVRNLRFLTTLVPPRHVTATCFAWRQLASNNGHLPLFPTSLLPLNSSPTLQISSGTYSSQTVTSSSRSGKSGLTTSSATFAFPSSTFLPGFQASTSRSLTMQSNTSLQQNSGNFSIISSITGISTLGSVSFCSVRNCMSDLIVNLWKSSGINTW